MNRYGRTAKRLAKSWLVALVLAIAPTAGAQGQSQVRVIVQGANAEAAAAAVEKAGGTVTHRLGIIKAVGAEMTPSQIRSLRQSDGVTRVYADNEAKTSASSTLTVRDQFGSASYANNNGSRTWTSSWVETGDDGQPGTGSVLVSGNVLSITGANRTVARTADLTSAASAILTFQYRRTSFDDVNDFVAVQVSKDGGSTWAEAGRLTGTANDKSFRSASYDISGLVGASTRLRFAASSSLGTADTLSIDDVQIQFVLGSVTRTVRDEFNGNFYGENDGMQRFVTDWAEAGDDGLPASGSVSIVSLGGNNRLRFGATGRSVTRRLSIPSAATSATLKLDYRRIALESTDYVSVQVSKNAGNSWTEVGRLGAGNDAAFASVTYDVLAHKAADFGVRFVSNFTANPTDPASTDDVFQARDAVYVDNVTVDFNGIQAGTKERVHIRSADVHYHDGITGRGTTVAVIDSGYWKHPLLDNDTSGNIRVRAQYDAIRNAVVSQSAAVTNDENGHGTHLASVIAGTMRDPNDNNNYFGIAPDAPLVSVKAFDKQGRGRYADIIRGLDWVLNNAAGYNIRVVNCSFGAPARSHYWDDPINQAVMQLWQAGIVVVASAGNEGPGAMSIGVPGNNPYVITVGALSDNYTRRNANDDFLAQFSSTGPTVEGFVKPELLGPGGHLWGLMPTGGELVQKHPTLRNDGESYMMSGTSQATAVVSGVVALMLEANPGLSAENVKCRLMSSAKPALNPAGNRAYSIFQQGAGLVNAYEAVHSTASGCANRGLNVGRDLSGSQHFGGPANRDANGNYYIRNASGNGYTWNGQYSSSTGYAWADAFNWTDGFAWGDGFGWTDTYAWSDGYGWTDGFVWGDSLSQPMSLNAWVPQQ